MLKDELETAKEAAQRAPSKTMKHLVERLRNQLALKEKQQKVHEHPDRKITMPQHAEALCYSSALPAIVVIRGVLHFIMSAIFLLSFCCSCIM